MKAPRNQDAKLRIFVGIKIPEKVIQETLKIQALLDNKGLFQGKWTKKENLHLTLKFLGEISKKQVNDATKSLCSIEIPPFEAELGRVGVFCFRKTIRIIWIHIFGEKVLELQKSIDHALANQFPPENRFMSHLTIARVKKVFDYKKLIQNVNEIQINARPFVIEEFKLIRSHLYPSGPTYSTLTNFPLYSRDQSRSCT